MIEDLQEQAYWLLLTFESGLPTRLIHEIIAEWCHQRGRTLQEFFAAGPQEWESICHVDTISKLEKAKEKIVGQVSLVKELAHNSMQLLPVLDDNYPKRLKSAFKDYQLPPILCYAGDLKILGRTTIAIIGSRHAGETSLAFTREVAHYLAAQGANVISGNARGVDWAAYEGATSTNGCMTIVLPHGICKLSRIQMRELLPKIEAGQVLLLSQFHPNASWLVSRAMQRNKVVTGLAQVVIVAESDIKGGTWNGAIGALKQNRQLYVYQHVDDTCSSDKVSLISTQSRTSEQREHSYVSLLAGNDALIERGGLSMPWPTENLADVLAPLLS